MEMQIWIRILELVPYEAKINTYNKIQKCKTGNFELLEVDIVRSGNPVATLEKETLIRNFWDDALHILKYFYIHSDISPD